LEGQGVKAPIEMPTSGAALQQFELQRIDYQAPEASGRIGGVQAGFPLWLASWSLGAIGVDRSDDWRSFLSEMRGATRRFLGRDLGRPYPKAHLSGFAGMTRPDASPFDGTAGASASGDIAFSGQPAADSTITINGTVFTFKAAGATGNQINIGATLSDTLDNAVTVLNASVVSGVAAATYSKTGTDTLHVAHDTPGTASNSFTLAAGAGSNGTPSGATLSGGAVGWSETITADGDSQLTLHNLPPEVLTLGTGDYIGFRWPATESSVAGLTWHAPVRVVRNGGGVADALGDLTVTCEPPVPSVVPAGAVAYLERPAAVFALVTGQSKLEGIDRRLAVRGGTIAGVQDLRA
jgi:hypothetical protein